MAKIELKNPEKSKACSLEQIKTALGETHACYVLLTCSLPTDEGKMEVEMSYEGDETLASYLVDNAQVVLNQQFSRSKDSC